MGVQEKSPAALELVLEENFDRLYQRLKSEEERAGTVVWGGFFRRTAAFSIDLLILAALLLVLFYLAYVGYTVGLAAHQEVLSEENLDVFLFFVSLGAIALVSGYFVLLHGMDGRTVGKWLFGLRVVGPGQQAIGYGRALRRWIATWISAIFGLGFLWILFSREKRGWHDLLGGTWVIREKKPG